MASETGGRREWRDGPVALTLAAVRHTYCTGASYLAAALSYYALTALMPLLLIGFTAAMALGGGTFGAEATTAASRLLTARGRRFVLGALWVVADRPGVLALAAAVAAGSAVQLFRTLERAFALVYAGPGRTLTEQVREAGFVLVAGLLGVLAVLLAAGAISVYANEEVTASAAPLATFAASFVALVPLYYGLPAPEVTLVEVLPGAALVAGVWTLLGAVFAAYALGSDGAALYGILGGLLLLVTWFYVANLSLLVGASLNALLAGRADPP